MRLLLILITCLPSTLLAGERTPKQWAKVLAERFDAIESYRAIYTASKPGIPPLPGMILEDRKSGAVLSDIAIPKSRGTYWWLPDKQGLDGQAYARTGDKVFRIEGFGHLLKQLKAMVTLLEGDNEPPLIDEQELRFRGYLILSDEHITAGLAAASGSTLPWFDSKLQEQVEETRVEEHQVQFILSDQSWIILDRKNGLLVERGFPVAGGARKLRLESVLPLNGLQEVVQEAPKVDGNTPVLRASESDISQMAHRQVFKAALSSFLQESEEERPAWLERVSSKLGSYWESMDSGGLPAGLPPDFAKQVRGKAAMKLLWETYQKEAPEKFAQVSLDEFQAVVEPRLVRMIADSLREKRKVIPSVVRLQNTLRDELKDLKGTKMEAGKQVALLLITSHLEALAKRVLETPFKVE